MEAPAISLPLRLIEKRYGSRSETDNAADEVIECVNAISDFPSQFSVNFRMDVSHDNPWYHTMTCKVEGMTSDRFAQLEQLLREKALID